MAAQNAVHCGLRHVAPRATIDGVTGPHHTTSPPGTEYGHHPGDARKRKTAEDVQMDALMAKVDALGQLVSVLVTGDSQVQATPTVPKRVPPDIAAQTAALTRSRGRYRIGTLGGTTGTVAMGLLATHLLAYNRGVTARDETIAEHTEQLATMQRKIDTQATEQSASQKCERGERARLELELGRMNRLHAMQWSYTLLVYDAIANKRKPPGKPLELQIAEAAPPTPATKCALDDDDDDDDDQRDRPVASERANRSH